MNHINQISEEVAKLRDHLSDNSRVYTNFKGDRGFYEDYQNTEGVPFGKMFRLDFEISAESASLGDEHPVFREFKAFDGQSAIAKMLLMQVETDLQDVVENGDMENYSDPLLKVMDGIVKHGGAEPTRVVIREARCFWEYNEKKDTREYTLYLNVYTEW